MVTREGSPTKDLWLGNKVVRQEAFSGPEKKNLPEIPLLDPPPP